jgi:ABC-type sugar transport system permease subunit
LVNEHNPHSKDSGEQRAPVESKARRRPRVLGRPLGFEHWALVPLLIFLLFFMVYPVLQLVRMSFSGVTLSGGGFNWYFTGLQNFYIMLNDQIFRAALIHTVIFVLVAVAAQLVMGTSFALMVERARWLSSTARNVLVWPAIITPVAISVTWWLILNIEFGLLLISAEIAKRSLVGSAHGQLTFKRSHRLARGKAS